MSPRPETGDGVERTDDGRYIIVNGRRWRASDPTIPEPFASELVRELMAARRAVRAAGENEAAVRSARDRVHRAKIALGERGEPWWSEPTAEGRDARIAATVLALLSARGDDKTICPSDVARCVASPTWRPVMDDVRRIARSLADDGSIEVVQKGVVVEDPATARGPIRYRLVAGDGE